MKRGLVIGKFMPIHNGHIALIEFARKQCDELIVSMSFTEKDEINALLRFSWMQEVFGHHAGVLLSMIPDNFDKESLPLPERTKIWADVMRQTYPPIDLVFSSEAYGDPFALNLFAKHVSFDPQRKKFPVSASMIRKSPFQNWGFIPESVRPFFVKKICFFGPESTGKTLLAEKLAEKFETEFVPEVARELITSNNFSEADIIAIGHAHYQRIVEKNKTANKILFCDTDAITTQIYSIHYLKIIPPVLFELEKKVDYYHYFLFDIDVPWIEDGLRDLGHLRPEMFRIFKEALDKRKISYTIVNGNWKEREAMVTAFVEKLLLQF